jgi:hypothetical protein
VLYTGDAKGRRRAAIYLRERRAICDTNLRPLTEAAFGRLRKFLIAEPGESFLADGPPQRFHARHPPRRAEAPSKPAMAAPPEVKHVDMAEAYRLAGDRGIRLADLYRIPPRARASYRRRGR